MIGQQISHYRVLREIGSGGMGVVYEAEDTRLGRHVALKFLPGILNLSPEAAERFEREARVASSLNHPNICTVYDIGLHDGRRFIVMELLEGESLRARINGFPLPVDLIVDVGVQIAEALDAAHGKHIVHRDVKPANIFLTKRGPAKLLDFGVAKPGGPNADGPPDETHIAGDTLTSAGSTIGSVNYMSPEQARGEAIDGRTDLFSLGVVLYEMATGRQAFSGPTTAVVFDALLNREPVPPAQLNAELPPELDRVIRRCLEKDRRLRYQTAADLASDLAGTRRDTGVRTVTAAGAPAEAAARARRPRPRWLTIGAPAVLVLAVAGFWFWNSARTPAFTERDLVYIADFTNTTGDNVFDNALKQAVSVQLQQTPYVTLLSDPQVQHTLRSMQRPPDEPVTGAVARELCQRAGAKATVDGSIAPLGSSYVIDLAVRNCQSGDVIAQQQVQAASKESVLGSVAGAVTTLRTHLGESLASIKKHDVPADATTSSLEALQDYGLALKTRVTKGDAAAIPFLQQALERDPNFALAYAKLGVIDGNLNRPADAIAATTRAYALRDHVSEYERLYIAWNYASKVLNDDARAKDALDLMIASYPRDYGAHNNLGVYYENHGDFAQAFAQYQAAMDIAPGEPLPIANAAYSLLSMSRFDDGYALVDRSLAIRPDPDLALRAWLAAAVQGDPRAAAFEARAEKISSSSQMAATRAELALWTGHLHDYLNLEHGLRESAKAENADAVAAVDADVDLTLGLFQHKIEPVRARILNPSTAPSTAVQDLAVLALSNDLAFVRQHITEVERRNAPVRAGTSAEISLILAHSLLQAAEGRGKDAGDAVRAWMVRNPGSVDGNYYAGRVFEASGQVDDAIASYRVMLKAAPSAGVSMAIPAARVSLARLLIARGDRAGADEQIAILSKQFKDADPDFALAKDVRELAAAK